MFVSGMRAVADSAEAIERRNPKGRCEITIRTTAGCSLTQRKTELFGKRGSASVENGALLAFERGAIKAAMNFELCATMDGLQRMETLFEGTHVCGVPGTKIESSPSHFRDDVDTGATFDDIRIDGYTAAVIVPLFDARDLCGEFMNSINALFRGQARMRGATMNDDFGFADAFAGSFYQTTWTERRFENEDGITTAGFRFDEDAGSLAANLFVRSPHKYDALGNGGLRFL